MDHTEKCIICFVSCTYTYDLNGIRDSKTVNGVTFRYLTQNGKVIRQTWTTGGVEYTFDFFYDNAGRPNGLWYTSSAGTNETFFYVLNQQGDVIRIVDQYGATQASYAYNAWGKVTTSSGWLASLNPIRYRGYYHDSETGFYYCQSRYYDPSIGRFINADSFMSTGQGFLGCNMFAYCENNPVNKSDESGQLSFFATVLLKATVAGITKATLSYMFGGSTAEMINAFTEGFVLGLISSAGKVWEGAVLFYEIWKTINEGISNGCAIGNILFSVALTIGSSTINFDECVELYEFFLGSTALVSMDVMSEAVTHVPESNDTSSCISNSSENQSNSSHRTGSSSTPSTSEPRYNGYGFQSIGMVHNNNYIIPGMSIGMIA